MPGLFGFAGVYSDPDLSSAETLLGEGMRGLEVDEGRDDALIRHNPINAQEVVTLLKVALNLDRFSAAANSRTGEVTAQWRSVFISPKTKIRQSKYEERLFLSVETIQSSEKEKYQERRLAAHKAARASDTYRKIRSSSSHMIYMYSIEEIQQSATIWIQWLSAWV